MIPPAVPPQATKRQRALAHDVLPDVPVSFHTPLLNKATYRPHISP